MAKLIDILNDDSREKLIDFIFDVISNGVMSNSCKFRNISQYIMELEVE